MSLIIDYYYYYKITTKETIINYLIYIILDRKFILDKVVK
jgi:hypothetical protein